MKKNVNKSRLTLNIILILLFVSLLVFVGLKYGPTIVDYTKDPQKLRSELDSFGATGVFIFIGLQIIQVVIAAIPGEFVQIAGGYIYGPWLGTLYSLIGIVTGSVVVFFISRLLGYTLVRTVASEKTLEKFNFLVNGNKSEIAMLLLFLIPGIPKDVLTYIAGITPVKPLKFFAIITIGRLPALFASSYIGSSAQKGNYLVVIILSAAAIALFAAGLFYKDRIMAAVQKTLHTKP